MYKTYGKTLKSIQADTLYPDAWKVSIQIKDLTPNNFNTYINYFVNGFEGSTKILHQTQNKNGDSLLTMDIGHVYKQFNIAVLPGQQEAIKREQQRLQAEQSRAQAAMIFGNTMSQEDVLLREQAQELARLNSLTKKQLSKQFGYNVVTQQLDEQVFNRKMEQLKKMGLNLYISEMYLKGKSSADRKQAYIKSAVQDATLIVGNKVDEQNIIDRSRDFMLDVADWQRQVLQQEGQDYINNE